jgi:RHS repeat-associated protein
MRVIEERDGNNNMETVYTRGTDLSGTLEGAGGIGGLLARSDQYSSGNPTRHNYYHADGNGNITYLVSSSQGLAASYRYDPFGRTISSSGTLAPFNLYRFSSKEVHANSGMYYYLYRFYDPNLQRWINRDPIQELGGPNLYAFNRHSPLTLIDPFGLECLNYGLNGTTRPIDQNPTMAPICDSILGGCAIIGALGLSWELGAWLLGETSVASSTGAVLAGPPTTGAVYGTVTMTLVQGTEGGTISILYGSGSTFLGTTVFGGEQILPIIISLGGYTTTGTMPLP